MKSYLTIITLCLSAFIARGQSVAFLSGKVYDKDRFPVANAFLKVQGTNYTAYSQEDGSFDLKVPVDKEFVLQIAASSATTKRKLGPYAVGKTFYKSFVLDKTVGSFDAVDIVYEKERDRPLTELDPKKMDRFANTGDFTQTIKLISGGISTAGGDQGSAYSVRGGNFDENLVYVNDIEIYRPFLVRAGQQEGLSVINPDMVESVQFSAGGFQAKYGDKLSSVLDIKYRQPDSFAATIQGSLLGANLHIQNKSKDNRFSYLVGARFRTNQYLLGSLDVQGDYQPRFFDVQSLLKYRITSDLSVSYLTSLSQNRYLVRPQNRETSFGNINSALSLFVGFDGQELMEYTTWMNGLSFDFKPKESSDYKLVLSSYITQEREHFTVEGAYRLSELETNLGSDDFANEKALLGFGYFIDHARNDLRAQVYTASFKARHLLNKSNISWGLGYTYESIEDRLHEWRYNDSSEYNISTRAQTANNEIVIDEFLQADIAIESFRLNAYIQNSQLLKESNNFRVNYGIRTNWWSFNDENVISPRIQFSFQPHKTFNLNLKRRLRDSLIGDGFDYSTKRLDQLMDSIGKRDWLWRFASGYYYQPPFYRELRNIDGVINPNLRAQRSLHVVFGGDLSFKAWGRPFKFTTETYYKHLDRMVPYVIDNVRIRYLAENSAQGYATGIEGRVNGEFISGIESWLNVGVMQTRERLYFTDENREEQLSDWIRRPTDQRVNFSVLFQDELPNNPSYKMNLGLVFGSKMPFFFDAENRQKEGFLIPAYRRVDIGFSKVLMDSESEHRPKWLRNSESLWVSLEVFNLLQVNNTISYVLIKDFTNTVYGVPNYLTGRRLNLRFILKV